MALGAIDEGVGPRIHPAHVAVVAPTNEVRRPAVLAEDLEDLAVSLRLPDVMAPDHEPVAASSAKPPLAARMKSSRHRHLLLVVLRSSPGVAVTASARAPIVGSEKYGLAARPRLGRYLEGACQVGDRKQPDEVAVVEHQSPADIGFS
jgi:hypothetical protein